MFTRVQWSLLELWDFLHQCSVVCVQASVCDQQEATEPSVPRMRSLQAVFTGHIKASLQRRRHRGNVSSYVGQQSALRKRPALITDMSTYVNFIGAAATVALSDLVLKGAFFSFSFFSSDTDKIIAWKIKQDAGNKWPLNTACCEL